MRLTAKTQEQREAIARILDEARTCYWFYDEDECEECDGFFIDDYLSFDEMSRIVDLLRSQ